MSNNASTIWYHSNRYHAQSACEYCEGVIRHEPWCVKVDALVSYANQIVADPNKLTFADDLILHALGVSWGKTNCQGACQNKTH